LTAPPACESMVIESGSRSFNHGCAGWKPGVDVVLLTGCPRALAYAVGRKRALGEAAGAPRRCGRALRRSVAPHVHAPVRRARQPARSGGRAVDSHDAEFRHESTDSWRRLHGVARCPGGPLWTPAQDGRVDVVRHDVPHPRFPAREVVPTTELVMRHIHPSDRDMAWESL